MAAIKRKKKRKGFAIGAVIALLAFSPALHATRILIFGDSWGEPMESALQSVFTDNGYKDVTVEATEFWGLAARLGSPEGLDFITKELNLRPDVDIVHLSIGSNDVHCLLVNSSCITNWDPLMAGTQAEADKLATIVSNTEIIVDHILSIRPEVQIFWAGGDYTRPRTPQPKYGTPFENNTVHNKHLMTLLPILVIPVTVGLQQLARLTGTRWLWILTSPVVEFLILSP